MYVAFMGTKQARDLVTDAAVLHEPVWAEAVALAEDKKVCDHPGLIYLVPTIQLGQAHHPASPTSSACNAQGALLCGR